ncbi:hypothetical protein CDL15_Pgr029013 [Punica granatum]|uniref:RIN4 pathogenic type III effector avirulence factor Avr cleavage site domain-containing protein n=1 Tax=Punica granatum TaxID=22663 RepID=A0A218XLD7_PUNGR|nr:hypothetical protein CDL15_Pgr029013 [Punica granatum]
MPLTQSHVPKFGNWDSDNVPYTTFFENARREKTGVKMNPNDPEENPEAFVFGQGGPAVGWPAVSAFNGPNRDKRSSSEKQQRSGASESGSSDRSSSGYSRRQQSYDRVQSDHSKKGPSESSKSYSNSVTRGPQHSRQMSGSQPSDDTHRRAASIPKFGAWDEMDPRSGESFTVIFNKVKEEKHNASSNFPTVPPQPISTYPGDRGKQTSPSLASKVTQQHLINN